jgi:hypothetical protein
MGDLTIQVKVYGIVDCTIYKAIDFTLPGAGYWRNGIITQIVDQSTYF